MVQPKLSISIYYIRQSIQFAELMSYYLLFYRGLLEDAAVTESAPHFTMRLRDRRVQMTYPVRLTCQVIGYPTPEIIWHKDNETITFGGTKSLALKKVNAPANNINY